MDYIEINVAVPQEQEELKDIVMAELAEAGCESFTESETGLLAYAPSESYNQKAIQEVLHKYGLSYNEKKIPAQNWNALWESNFDPVIVDDRCLIYASFHKNLKKYPYEILIDPKMSFGTGHHETTALVISSMFNLDFKGKNVLDMGCGTGVLAIMASKLGAAAVDAIDIDAWSVVNTRENLLHNDIRNVTLKLGEASLLKNTSFDIILANINRNILLQDMKTYDQVLANGGQVLLSGFYRQDVDIIREEASKCKWDFISFKEKNDWVATLFQKNIH